MKSKKGARCCFAGAMIATISWGLIFFLYANLDSPELSSRKLTYVPRNVIVPFHINPSPQPTRVNRDDNRPGHHKVARSQDQHKVKTHDDSHHDQQQLQGLDVIEGVYMDPVNASPIFTKEDQKHYNQGIRHHSFNAYLSSKLSFHRPLVDTRDERCLTSSYDSATLVEVSIVMCFYNEALSVLLRSIHSILDRTEHSLIKEIILVDDYSADVELKGKLDRYISEKFSSKVILVRNPQREGLIRSRMIGARAANAKVLVFLDSHIEVNTGWLEPLVSRVAGSASTVVVPMIDIIDSDTFVYKKSSLVRGGFTWSMRFSWEEIPPSVLLNDPLYISSPTMAGGLLAIHKEYFFHLGGYDAGMDIWGGENIEMSLRVWMCGGQIEMAICSRVGHIFRRVRPYSSPTGEDTMTKNTLRMVNVWLDDYKEQYHKATKNHHLQFNYGDISERQALRKSLNCRDFEWYLQDVYNPDMRMLPAAKPINEKMKRVAKSPSSRLKVINKGKLKLANTEYCIVPSPSDKVVSNSPIVIADCSTVTSKWYELDSGGFLFEMNKCLDVVSSSPTISKCTNQGGTQQWIIQYKENNSGVMFNPGVGLCLHAPKQQVGDELKMSTCDEGSSFIYDKKTKSS